MHSGCTAAGKDKAFSGNCLHPPSHLHFVTLLIASITPYVMPTVSSRNRRSILKRVLNNKSFSTFKYHVLRISFPQRLTTLENNDNLGQCLKMTFETVFSDLRGEYQCGLVVGDEEVLVMCRHLMHQLSLPSQPAGRLIGHTRLSLCLATGMADYDFPWEYNFPPFFTIQPNADTRNAQMQAWRSLVVGYCTSKKIYSMEVTDALNHPLFQNKQLGRGLSQEGLHEVLTDLQKHGHLEWADKRKTKFLIHWKTVKQWSKILYEHATSCGLTNSVCTFFELTMSDDVQDKEFYGLDETVLKKALQMLQEEGKAVLINFEGSEGVKFL